VNNTENKSPTSVASELSDDQKPTEEAPVLKKEESTEEAPKVEAPRHETTKKIAIPTEGIIPDAPTRPSKKEHNTDYYRTHIMDSDNVLHRLLSVPQTRELSAPPDVKRVTLHIRGIKEHVVMTQDRVVIVGRADLRADGFKPDIDLSPYGARERGVSRAHIRLHLEAGKLFMTDLYSANGTFMGGERLDAEKPIELHNGDEVLVGALGIHIEIL
jgi:FHA domain-containing protein